MTDKQHTPSTTDSSGTHTAATGLGTKKGLVVLGFMVVAFLGAYNYAVAQTQTPGEAPTSIAAQASGLFAAPAAGGDGCCGGGGAPVEGAAEVTDGVQRIDVDTSQGSFNPNVIKVKAGVPIEMNFSQAPGGCLSGVFFPDFSINEDLTDGGKTVKLPALDAGEYTFYCQMQMVSATIVAE